MTDDKEKPMPWTLTHALRQVTLEHPRVADIEWADIAISLSRLPRFLGHTRIPYSVAAHSLFVYDLARATPGLHGHARASFSAAALLHDGHEAYLGDVPTPVKRFFPAYDDLARGFDKAMAEKIGLEPSWFWFDEVRALDRFALEVEMRTLFPTEAANIQGFYPSGVGSVAPAPMRAALVDIERYLGWPEEKLIAVFLDAIENVSQELRRHPR